MIDSNWDQGTINLGTKYKHCILCNSGTWWYLTSTDFVCFNRHIIIEAVWINDDWGFQLLILELLAVTCDWPQAWQDLTTFLSWKQSFYLSWYMNPSPGSRMSCLDKTYRNVWCWNSKWLILQFELFSRSRCSFTYHYPFAALSAINVGNITLLTNYINCKLHKPEISESIRCSLMPSNWFTASSSSWDSRRLSFSSESESLWIELMF